MNQLSEILLDGRAFFEDNSIKAPFRKQSTFICCLYHEKLNRYKPPGTSKISIELVPIHCEPDTFFFGSILNTTAYFDKKTYLTLDKRAAQHYLLNLLHETLLSLGAKYGWDIEIFKTAHNDVVRSDFRSLMELPVKRSPDKEKFAHPKIERTETSVKVFADIRFGGKQQYALLFERPNHYPDNILRIAKKLKWIDKDRFGIFINYNQTGSWFDTTSNTVVSNIKIAILGANFN